MLDVSKPANSALDWTTWPASVPDAMKIVGSVRVARTNWKPLRCAPELLGVSNVEKLAQCVWGPPEACLIYLTS